MAECCTCGSTDSNRYTRLNQKSGKRRAGIEELIDKLFYVLNIEFVKFDAICDRCIRKLDGAYQFIKKARTIQLPDQDSSVGSSTTADLENKENRDSHADLEESVVPSNENGKINIWDTCTLPSTMVESVHVAYDKWGLMPPYPLNYIQVIATNHIKSFKE